MLKFYLEQKQNMSTCHNHNNILNSLLIRKTK